MNVCVLGLWHLGSVTSACLSSVGHKVTGLDFDLNLINDLNNGKAPIFEPGLNNLLERGIYKKNLLFTSKIDEATKDCDVLWVTYDTPVDKDDCADFQYVIKQVQLVLPFLKEKSTILVSSQMPVGSIKDLELFAKNNFPKHDFGFAYSPENLRLGNALEVFLNPDRIVIGFRSNYDQIKIKELLNPITDNLVFMSIESAEMTKHAINAFLATSVTFANEIAIICELVGADAKEVEKGLKTEQRIGPKAYLSPGAAFSGGTLARDITFLAKIANNKSLTLPLIKSIKESNNEHKNWVKKRLLKKFTNLSGIRIAIWGLTYKPCTNTLRRSLSVELCNWLLEQGVFLHVHDPAVDKLPSEWTTNVTRYNHPEESIQYADAIVVATEWPEYREISLNKLSSLKNSILMVDSNRFLQKFSGVDMIEYAAVGAPHNEIKL
jgi:UDPglucose 6-dehydrogenase